MRFAVITDAHANLPALRAALAFIDRVGTDIIVHMGDAIGIGPHPRECLDLLLSRPDVHCLMGNHDAWFACGLPDPRPSWMSPDEWEHQLWTHSQLSAAHRLHVASWPYSLHWDTEVGTLLFLHFPRDPTGEFLSPRAAPTTPEEATAIFGADARLICFGHQHESCDLESGTTRYLNPGSLGCNDHPAARVAFVSARASAALLVTHGTAPYSPTELIADFDRRAVPARDFIRRTFMSFGSAGVPVE
jgi:predicted phosphodiesterase